MGYELVSLGDTTNREILHHWRQQNTWFEMLVSFKQMQIHLKNLSL